jgi:hypothetical protein
MNMQEVTRRTSQSREEVVDSFHSVALQISIDPNSCVNEKLWAIRNCFIFRNLREKNKHRTARNLCVAKILFNSVTCTRHGSKRSRNASRLADFENGNTSTISVD